MPANQHCPVRLVLQTQAVKLRKIGGQDDYMCCSCWRYRWKKRHAIKAMKTCREARSADLAAAKSLHLKLQELTEEGNFPAEQIYNTEHTGLNYKQLPDRTLACKTVKPTLLDRVPLADASPSCEVQVCSVLPLCQHEVFMYVCPCCMTLPRTRG